MGKGAVNDGVTRSLNNIPTILVWASCWHDILCRDRHLSHQNIRSKKILWNSREG
jgi:hypothetical protein